MPGTREGAADGTSARRWATSDIRRLGGRRALEPLFESYGMPANSDYYPYLDLNAPRLRFLQRSASDMVALLTEGVPVLEMLEPEPRRRPLNAGLHGAEAFARIENTRVARYARAFLLQPTAPEPVAISSLLQKDLEVSKLRLIECREPQRYDIWFHSLYGVARSVNPLLPANEARALWERLEKSSCISALGASQRRWLELFKAVGARDAARMAQMAEMLLTEPSDLPPDHRQYLMMAGMTGYVAQGRREQAAALWNRYPNDVRKGGEDLALRLLKAHAFAGR